MRKYWYTPQLMVPSTIEMETGNIMLGTWTRYFLSLTMLPDQIKVNWRVRPISKDPDQEGKEEIFKSPQEYMDWYNNLKKTYGKRIARKGLFRFAYDEDTITDQPERAICAEIIREKALHALNDEVPHGIAVGIDRMKTRKTKSGSIIDMDATIVCERDSHKGIIIGKQGSMLKKIGTNARYEMERLLDCKVNLKLWVKVKKDWRDSDFLIKNFGYKEEE